MPPPEWYANIPTVLAYVKPILQSNNQWRFDDPVLRQQLVIDLDERNNPVLSIYHPEKICKVLAFRFPVAISWLMQGDSGATLPVVATQGLYLLE